MKKEPLVGIVVALLSVISVIACVPASEPRPPAGAGGFTVKPSAESAGKPFENDGWTLAVKKIIVRASVAVTPDVIVPIIDSAGGYDELLFDATKPSELFSPGVSVGDAKIDIRLSSYPESSDSTFDSQTTNVNVDTADAQRFSLPTDESIEPANSQYSFVTGPSVVFVVTGQRDDRTVTLNVAVNAQSQDNGSQDGSGNYVSGASIKIQANQLSLAILDVSAERVFDDPSLTFSDIANADADHDGIVTGAELSSSVSSSTDAPTLLDALAAQIGSVLISPETN